MVNELYADKPSEITRLSLLRAKFAEKLAGVFGMENKGEELFLMGLFSVLDVILEKPMEDALEMVKVDGEIRGALIRQSGPLAPVLELMTHYETANWQDVSRQLVLAEIDVKPVSEAYEEALRWYRDLMAGEAGK